MSAAGNTMKSANVRNAVIFWNTWSSKSYGTLLSSRTIHNSFDFKRANGNAEPEKSSPEQKTKSPPQLYAWGLVEHGALGLARNNRDKKGKVYSRYKNKPVRHYFGEENRVTHVDCGFGFTVYSIDTCEKIKLFGSGINTDSQIGYHDPRTGHPMGILLSPAPIDLGLQYSETKIVSLSAGRSHVAVATDLEGVFTLGSNCYGQCGRPIIENEKYTGSGFVHNIKCIEGEVVQSVVCGQDHTLFLTDCGKVYSCGWGADGQTGLDSNENECKPTRVKGAIRTEKIVKLCGKSDTVLALSEEGKVFGWGNTEYYQFTREGDERQSVFSPVALDKLEGHSVKDIAAGGSMCLALTTEGDVLVWGYGILGAGPSVEYSSKPIALPRALFGTNEFQPDSRVVSVTCGLSHAAAVTNLSNLYTWGLNRHGCLGVGHSNNQYFPYKVSIGACVYHVACGVDHTMALSLPYV